MKYGWLVVLLIKAMLVQAQIRITLIGTVHEPTDKIHSAVLYQYLQRIQPHVILLELDTSLMNDQGQWLTSLSTLETEAVQKYQKNYAVVLRPYDIKNRNAYYKSNNTFQKEAAFFNSLDSAYRTSSLDSCSRAVFEQYLRLNQLVQQLHKETIEVINTTTARGLISARQKMLYQDLLSVAQRTPSLQQHAAFWKSNGDFWKLRNETMAEHILQYAREYKDREVVVLTGYYHLYYLQALLEQRAAGNNSIIKVIADL